MIRKELAKPVVLWDRIKGIAPLLEMDEKTLRDLSYGSKSLLTEDFGDFKKHDIVDSEVIINSKGSISGFLYGGEAIDYLLNEKGLEGESISEIHIPVSVYHECSDKQWLDISYLAARTIGYIDRFKKLSEMGVPFIIAINEYKQMMWKVNVLESNQYPDSRKAIETHKDGTSVRSLKSIGYSLKSGWCAGMLAEFERRDAEWDRMMDEAIEEAVEEND